MGNYVDRLQIIKARFLDSSPNDVNLFFQFLQEQFTRASSSDSRLVYLYPLSPSLIKSLNTDTFTGEDLIMALDFAEHSIIESRSKDSIDELGILEFYNREAIYSKLELFFHTLKRT
jgi:hypothetical protein